MSLKVEENHPGFGWCLQSRWLDVRFGWVSNEEVRRTSDSYAWHIIGWGRWHQWQRASRIPRGSLGCSPSTGGGSSDRGSDWNSMSLRAMRASHNSHRSVWKGRDPWVKANCPSLRMKDQICCNLPLMVVEHGCFSATPVGMIVICYLVSFEHYKGFWVTKPGVQARMPSWVTPSRCWMSIMAS